MVYSWSDYFFLLTSKQSDLLVSKKKKKKNSTIRNNVYETLYHNVEHRKPVNKQHDSIYMKEKSYAQEYILDNT